METVKIVVAIVIGVGAAAGILGVAWFTFRSQARKVKADVVRELNDVIDALGEKIKILKELIDKCAREHKECEEKVNEVTQFNLRFQAREKLSHTTINRLERKLGLDETEWDATES